MKGSRCLPPDFTPDESVYLVAAKVGLDRDAVEREMDKLRDHEFRRPYHDWQKVARNWMRNAADYQRRPAEAAQARSIGFNDWKPETIEQEAALAVARARIVGGGR